MAFALWAPFALARAPEHAAGALEVSRLWPCLALSLAILGFSRGSFVGITGLRLGWFAGLVISVGLAIWEVTTGHHLWIDEAHPWAFARAQLPVGTYINPNNFGTALVAMIAGSLALAATLRARWMAGVVYAVVTLGAVTVAMTQGRSAVVALIVVLAFECRRRIIERRTVTGKGIRDRWATMPYANRQAAWSLAAVLGVLGVALFALPTFAARNPLARMLADQFNEETARSDTLRTQLIAAAARYLRESGWLGSGAGSFEPLLWADPEPGTTKLTNLHNAFVELLSQYGVHIGGLYALAVAGVVAALLRATRTAAARTRVVQYEACGHLVAVLALGVAASSALHVPTWWVALAAASACAWHASVMTGVPAPAAKAADAQAKAAARAARSAAASTAPISEKQVGDRRRLAKAGAS